MEAKWLPDLPVSKGLGLDRDDVRVLLLALRNLGLIGRHVELRRPLAADYGKPLLDGRLVPGGKM